MSNVSQWPDARRLAEDLALRAWHRTTGVYGTDIDYLPPVMPDLAMVNYWHRVPYAVIEYKSVPYPRDANTDALAALCGPREVALPLVKVTYSRDPWRFHVEPMNPAGEHPKLPMQMTEAQYRGYLRWLRDNRAHA